MLSKQERFLPPALRACFLAIEVDGRVSPLACAVHLELKCSCNTLATRCRVRKSKVCIAALANGEARDCGYCISEARLQGSCETRARACGCQSMTSIQMWRGSTVCVAYKFASPSITRW